MRLLLRHKLLVAATTLVAAGSAGGAYAASQSGTSARQAFINDVAKRLNVSPGELRSALRGALLDRIQAAVKAGRLTQAQANRIEQRIESGKLPPPLGANRPWRPGRFGGPGGLNPGGPLHAATSYLGLGIPQLLGELRSGKSLAQVAKARGKSVSGLEQAVSAAEKARLNRLVAAGWLSKAQEKRILSHLSARVDLLVHRAGLGPRPVAGPRLRAVPGGPGFGPAGGGPPTGPPPPGPGPLPPAA